MATAIDDATGAIRNRATYASLHSSDPGSSGSNEISGSGYSRQAISWGSVSGGQVTMSGTLGFDGPASGSVTHVGLWTAASGGTFVDAKSVTGDQAFNAAGEYSVTDLTITTTKN